MSRQASGSSTALIACDVFEEELAALAGNSPPWCACRFLEMGLHDRPDNLRREITRLIGEIEADSVVKTIVLAYGLCGNGLVGIRAGRCRIVLPRAHDCISILLGSPARHSSVLRENPGTYFYSPGWVRGRRVPGPDREAYLRELYGERYGDDEEMIDELVDVDRETFAHHNCAAYVDLTDNREAEDYCKDCAASLGWSYRRLEGDPGLLRDLLAGDWDAERFLVLEPGEQVALANDGRIVRAEAAE